MKHLISLFFAAVSVVLLAGAAIFAQALAPQTPFGTADHSSMNLSRKPLDPRGFGNCVWDGTHDVTPCIQAAVDTAATKRRAVHLPPGVLELAQSVKLSKNVTIIGERNQTVLKPTSGNNSKPVLLQGNNVTNILLKNVIFDGGGEDFSNPNPLVIITRGQNVIFDGITVQNARGAGVILQGGTSRSGVRNSRIMHVGNHWKTTLNRTDRLQGLVFCCGTGNSDNFAIGNYFEDIGLDALQFSRQSRFIAADNAFTLENNQHTLIKAPDFPAAIFPMNSIDSTITHNNIGGAQGCGIDAPALRHSVISMNIIHDSQACGIGLFQGYDKTTQTSNISIVDNIITNNVQWRASPFKGGITIAKGAPKNITISRNTITNTQGNSTQAFGIQVLNGTQISGLKIDHSNKLNGNAVAAFDHANFSER